MRDHSSGCILSCSRPPYPSLARQPAINQATNHPQSTLVRFISNTSQKYGIVCLHKLCPHAVSSAQKEYKERYSCLAREERRAGVGGASVCSQCASVSTLESSQAGNCTRSFVQAPPSVVTLADSLALSSSARIAKGSSVRASRSAWCRYTLQTCLPDYETIHISSALSRTECRNYRKPVTLCCN